MSGFNIDKAIEKIGEGDGGNMEEAIEDDMVKKGDMEVGGMVEGGRHRLGSRRRSSSKNRSRSRMVWMCRSRWSWSTRTIREYAGQGVLEGQGGHGGQ